MKTENKVNRTERFMVRFKKVELDYLRREADERRQRLSDYIRTTLLTGAILSYSDDKNKG